MADDHYLPLFVGDFMASTATWTGPERGLYVQLLMFQWASGPLPADLRRLARVVGYDWDEFTAVWTQISGKFTEIDGKLANPKLEEHRIKNAEVQARRHERAVHAASVRHARSTATSNAPSNALSMPSDPIRSDLLRSDPSSTHEADPEVLREIRESYPDFTGRQDWLTAQHHCCRLVDEGVGWSDLLAGVQRYARYCREGGVSSPRYVLTPAKFFGSSDKPWSQPWRPPPTKAQQRQDDTVNAAKQWLEGGSAA